MVPGLRAIWMLATTVVAVRQALDYRGSVRAVGLCAVGWVVQMVLVAVVLFFLRGLARAA